ncbi:hypothetical protein FOC4_g10001717 [Fusarium odoratissimum]|uniref:Uncharacterized protein n=1 Tax=Fusarium oxysporum f. sp. cubense (strain race 4) TaxID=2502994 RepID=N1S3U1_FUSC4|nr:hypothetical protein FOC4_g10001717 [Fusarium odoratissimum]
MDAELSWLGYLTSPEQGVGPGCWQSFQHGAMYWLPNLGAFALSTSINDKYNSLGGPLGVKSKVESMGRDLTTKGAQIAGEKAGQAIEAEIAGKAGLAGTIAAVGTWLGGLLDTPAPVVGNVIGGLLENISILVGCVVHPLTNGHVLQIISYYYFSYCQSLHPILRVEIKRPNPSSTSANSAGV